MSNSCETLRTFCSVCANLGSITHLRNSVEVSKGPTGASVKNSQFNSKTYKFNANQHTKLSTTHLQAPCPSDVSSLGSLVWWQSLKIWEKNSGFVVFLPFLFETTGVNKGVREKLGAAHWCEQLPRPSDMKTSRQEVTSVSSCFFACLYFWATNFLTATCCAFTLPLLMGAGCSKVSYATHTEEPNWTTMSWHRNWESAAGWVAPAPRPRDVEVL